MNHEPITNIRMVHSTCGINKLSKEQLDQLEAGAFIKLLDNNERFWAIIYKINDDEIIAKVDNDLVNAHSFQFDDIITVKKEDIIGHESASSHSRSLVLCDKRYWEL